MQWRRKSEKKEKEKPTTLLGKIKEYTMAILVPLGIVMVLQASIVKAYHVPTGSMRTTIEIGDNLIVNRFIYGPRTPDMVPVVNIQLPHYVFPLGRDPKAGEIIVFKYPLDPSTEYVKRCLATPGQTVEIKQDIVYIDGKPEGVKKFLHREYDPEEQRYIDVYEITRPDGIVHKVRYVDDPGRQPQDWGPKTLPEGQYFVMGDNRDNSADSRYWGWVPRENIHGKALMVYFSWKKYLPLSKIASKIRWGRIGTFLE
ncbi:signal peptidase I [candidate division KSB1 bacterium]|nr:signal peptidase I [candidate division KSB1 bacterium]